MVQGSVKWRFFLPKISTPITDRLTGDEYTSLSALIEKHDVSLSWLMRAAVDEFLQEYSEDREQLVPNLPTQQLKTNHAPGEIR